jgi:hypothetical protein
MKCVNQSYRNQLQGLRQKAKKTMKIGVVELGLMQEWFIFVKLSKRTM